MIETFLHFADFLDDRDVKRTKDVRPFSDFPSVWVPSQLGIAQISKKRTPISWDYLINGGFQITSLA